MTTFFVATAIVAWLDFGAAARAAAPTSSAPGPERSRHDGSGGRVALLAPAPRRAELAALLRTLLHDEVELVSVPEDAGPPPDTTAEMTVWVDWRKQGSVRLTVTRPEPAFSGSRSGPRSGSRNLSVEGGEELEAESVAQVVASTVHALWHDRADGDPAEPQAFQPTPPAPPVLVLAAAQAPSLAPGDDRRELVAAVRAPEPVSPPREVRYEAFVTWGRQTGPFEWVGPSPGDQPLIDRFDSVRRTSVLGVGVGRDTLHGSQQLSFLSGSAEDNQQGLATAMRAVMASVYRSWEMGRLTLKLGLGGGVLFVSQHLTYPVYYDMTLAAVDRVALGNSFSAGVLLGPSGEVRVGLTRHLFALVSLTFPFVGMRLQDGAASSSWHKSWFSYGVLGVGVAL